MKKIIYKIERWFNLNIGWFFISPRRQEEWCEYLKQKYPDIHQKSTE